MKTIKLRTLLSAAVILTAPLCVFGQDQEPTTSPAYSSPPAFGKGTNMINAGIGLGGYYNYSGFGYTQSPVFTIMYENGTFGNVGPGTISLGASLSYKMTTNNWIGNDGFSYSELWRYWVIGLRGAYHLNVPGAPRFDPYAGIMLGYYILGYSFTTNNPNYAAPGNPGYVYYSMSYPDYFYPSVFLGARYMLSNSVGLWGELGYGYSAFNLGLSVKL